MRVCVCVCVLYPTLFTGVAHALYWLRCISRASRTLWLGLEEIPRVLCVCVAVGVKLHLFLHFRGCWGKNSQNLGHLAHICCRHVRFRWFLRISAEIRGRGIYTSRCYTTLSLGGSNVGNRGCDPRDRHRHRHRHRRKSVVNYWCTSFSGMYLCMHACVYVHLYFYIAISWTSIWPSVCVCLCVQYIYRYIYIVR